MWLVRFTSANIHSAICLQTETVLMSVIRTGTADQQAGSSLQTSRPTVVPEAGWQASPAGSEGGSLWAPILSRMLHCQSPGSEHQVPGCCERSWSAMRGALAHYYRRGGWHTATLTPIQRCRVRKTPQLSVNILRLQHGAFLLSHSTVSNSTDQPITVRPPVSTISPILEILLIRWRYFKILKCVGKFLYPNKEHQ